MDSQSRRSAQKLPPLVPQNLADIRMWWIRRLGMGIAGVSTESPRSAPLILLGMMPLLLGSIAESAQQVEEILQDPEGGHAFSEKGMILTAASAKKSGFRTFDSSTSTGELVSISGSLRPCGLCPAMVKSADPHRSPGVNCPKKMWKTHGETTGK